MPTLRVTMFAAGLAVSLLTARLDATPGAWRPPAQATRSYAGGLGDTSSMTFNGAKPASNYFCGNGCKYPSGKPCTGANCCIEQPNVSCHNIAWLPVDAREKVEIRGWLLFSGPKGCDSEWDFYILLDVGWIPDPAIYPSQLNEAVNSIYQVAKWIPPTNVILYGQSNPN